MIRYAPQAAFLLALAATAGSLFMGEVLKYPACTLCWYQRICMFPLPVRYGVALWTDAKDYLKYCFPLILIGLSIAVYHNLLYYGVIPESITPCTQGVSCTARQVELLGFLTIPLMSLLSFGALGAIALADLRARRKK